MPRANLLRSVCVLTLALGATACGTVSDKLSRTEALKPGTGSNLTTTERFAFNVAEQPDRIQLAPQAGALSPRQVEALSELARRWREDGRGVVRIETPAGGGNAVIAGQAANAAVQVLQRAGVPPTAIVQSNYNAAGQAAPTVAVGFTRLMAVVPDCASYQSDLTRTGSNEPHGAFGCAVTSNMAVQVADPEDLLGPKPEGAPDTARRAFVLDTYRKGKPTGTPRSDNPREATEASDR